MSDLDTLFGIPKTLCRWTFYFICFYVLQAFHALFEDVENSDMCVNTCEVFKDKLLMLGYI